MPGAIRSSKWLTSLSKTEEMLKKSREAEGKLEPPLTEHRTLFSPVDNAHVPAFPTFGSSVISVPADNVHRLPNSVPAVDVDRLHSLRSRSKVISIIKSKNYSLYIYT